MTARLSYDEANEIALREWNLARPAWKPFKRIKELTLAELYCVVVRAQKIRFGTEESCETSGKR